MERNDKTTAGMLKIGDRFYKAKDKQKRAYEMVEGDAVVTQYRTYKLFCVPASIMDAKLIPAERKLTQAEAILSNTEVFFLRRV